VGVFFFYCFPLAEVDPTDGSVLHVALREEKEDKILGRLGPPTVSLSGLRV